MLLNAKQNTISVFGITSKKVSLSDVLELFQVVLGNMFLIRLYLFIKLHMVWQLWFKWCCIDINGAVVIFN